MNVNLAILTALFFSLGPAKPEPAMEEGRFVLSIENILEDKGQLQLALFSDEDSFLDYGKECYSTTLPVSETGDKTVMLPLFPLGDYAIAVYHDLNEDGKLNTNLWGIPTEPYAFSKPPASKWKKPTFASTSVSLDQEQKEIRVALRRWKDF